MSAIVFENQKRWYSINNISKKRLKSTIIKIAQDHKFHVELVSVILLSDKKLREINITYLNHDYFTDVITFDLSGESKVLIGEIYISKDSIARNALHYHCSTEQEFVRVALHGTLHLCGYKDKSSNQQKLMRSKEDYYLEHYFQNHDK